MKKYLIQKGDSLSSVAVRHSVKDAQTLRSFDNTHCPLQDLLGYELLPGKELLIPQDKQYLKEDEEIADPLNGFDDEAPSAEKSAESQGKQTIKEKKTENNTCSSGPHDGKYFVVQKGTCQCNQGFKFPKFKVTSHQKHYWNDGEGKSDYLAVTEDDNQFDPPAQPFGQCKLKPSSGGYLPCAYAPAGKWTKTYEKVKIMDKSCVTEISELMCTSGGKITILKHGQQSEPGKSHVAKANPQEQHVYNPIMDFDEFQEESGTNYGMAW
ncbi:DUF4280 and LysM peptidoglycan-binding domain-containing protein [Chryseobacterium shandongense]|uniref:DUF4280 and LysM peptidoglycan-binding domain-containing protein n=1 Tax=Chryseobacterium shandongense TaxID=1493872 RepID=UPI000F4D44A2|nr:PAAR-like protein [Chryseobacterium shandongense]AZA59274.1 DUF4280 domain-containing protein [Chryseobacterium shandongense]